MLRVRVFWGGSKLILFTPQGLEPLIPFAILLVTTFAWIHYSPMHIMAAAPRAMFVLVGILFSNIAVGPCV